MADRHLQVQRELCGEQVGSGLRGLLQEFAGSGAAALGGLVGFDGVEVAGLLVGGALGAAVAGGGADGGALGIPGEDVLAVAVGRSGAGLAGWRRGVGLGLRTAG
ncbi:hypothetical protein [Streptacidiphilus rugosus]|uniref:hypothetical protein n=1 Tax=Streptacidiphilus rugosus TaxID=405783 RepID=UPI000568BFAD|nr:hypothetical protein [Streptacidiphilus rugosus]